ncbi:MAG: hypothetical protein C6P37_11610 [Caldibacillus debilis]|uniref:Oxalate:formate antiporter n=1 Tax=Caldibacillus debilis TaxID=301148 RepID=A0A3E0K2W8_9BACI|nr:hypothetical protein [Caldibacillus debilis]REJ27458.1 MAG: hypothetical protein C6P37_11610 [Caldibacillus debilis]
MKKMPQSNERNDLIYILVNAKDQYIISSGIDFKGFMESLDKKPSYLLLLKHKFGESEYHLHTQLDYVTQDQIRRLEEEDIKNYGDFCWIDFDDLFTMDSIEEEELAELLYLGHRKRHLSPPFYQKLNNRFVYLTEMDGWMNKIYFRSWQDFYQMFGNVISRKLSALKIERSFLPFRKKNIFPPVDREVIHQLTNVFSEGGVFSLGLFHSTRQRIEIPFWTLGDFYNMDEMMEQYDVRREEEPSGVLVFDKKTRQWTVNFPSGGKSLLQK